MSQDATGGEGTFEGTFPKAHKPAYWAARESEDFAKAVAARVNAYYDYLRTSGRWALLVKLYDAWHAGARDLGSMKQAGARGEFTLMRVNHLRNIGVHTVNLVTAERPTFDARASNTDYDSEVQCQLAQSILDYDMRAKRMEAVLRESVEYAVEFGEGWVGKVWDNEAGEPWGLNPLSGLPIFSGTIRYDAYNPTDVIRDPFARASAPLRWVITRRWVNRYDLLARFGQPTFLVQEDGSTAATWSPEVLKLRDAITGAPCRREVADRHFILGYERAADVAETEGDEVEVFEFYHARTEAVPDGRRALLVGESVLEDGPLPYRRIPVFPIRAGMQPGTNMGYTVMNDLLPLQDAVNALFSTVASNQAAYGIQSLLVPKGFGLDVEAITKGLQVIHYDPALGKPEALQLTATAPETFKFLEALIQTMETLSAVNGVTRGDPQASLKSGSALAMVASQALQFTVDLQAAYVLNAEDIASAAIEDYQDFADLPQVALVVGKANRSHVREWRNKDIAKVQRVHVDVGNALSKTLAGRSEMATQLVQAGLVPDARSYIEVLTTGRLEAVTSAALSELLCIRSENERMSLGSGPVHAIDTDDHPLHVREHKVVLATPESREDPRLVQVVLAHIQEHLSALRLTDPLLLNVIGVPSAAGTGGPGGAPGQAPPPNTEELPPGPPGEPPSGGASYVPPMPSMPQPPKNPATGERAKAPVAAPTPPGAKPAAQ